MRQFPTGSKYRWRIRLFSRSNVLISISWDFSVLEYGKSDHRSRTRARYTSYHLPCANDRVYLLETRPSRSRKLRRSELRHGLVLHSIFELFFDILSYRRHYITDSPPAKLKRLTNHDPRPTRMLLEQCNSLIQRIPCHTFMYSKIGSPTAEISGIVHFKSNAFDKTILKIYIRVEYREEIPFERWWSDWLNRRWDWLSLHVQIVEPFVRVSVAGMNLFCDFFLVFSWEIDEVIKLCAHQKRNGGLLIR